MDSIQIFACDHRKNIQWNLPYVRFGGSESDCAIKNDKNEIFGIACNADETPKIYWLWMKIPFMTIDANKHIEWTKSNE